MWWDRSEPLEIYLSEREIGFAHAAFAPARWSDVVEVDESMERLRFVLSTDELLAVRRIRIWLSNGLARPFLVPATSGARNAREARTLAGAMAADATGLQGPLRLWNGRWRAGEPVLAAAMEQAHWQRLQDVVEQSNQAHGLLPRNRRPPVRAITSVRPWWNLPFDDLLAQTRDDGTRVGWSLACEDGLVHGVIERGAPVEIGFDRPGAHDFGAAQLVRRLEVNWGSVDAIRHLRRARDAGGASSHRHLFGDWQPATKEIR